MHISRLFARQRHSFSQQNTHISSTSAAFAFLMQARRAFAFGSLLIVAAILVACGGGGGGGGGGSGSSITGVQPTDLVISEVGSCYYYDVDCWFEIYNPTGDAIDLVGYQIKSSSVNSLSGIGSTTTFSLPSLVVPAESYVLVSGNVDNLAQRGTQMVRVRSGNTVPFWTSQGFIEILKGGETVDFVRFGASTQAPTTSGHWSGSSVSSLASSATNYGRAIVRAHPISLDSNTASDWKSVAWATPAGRNDVGSSATDADGDGIPDSAEVSGGTFAGLDLYAMGARTGKRDIFIEVDYMDIADPGVIPRAEALQKVVDAFAAKNIAVHFDAGTLFNPSFSTANFNLGQDSNEVPYEPCVAFNQTTCIDNVSSRRSIYDYKAEYMDLRRRGVFHYLLFANSLAANGAQSSSGLAELEGNDLIVSLGNWGLDDTAGPNLNILINAQAGTVMHELGHNLGLRHGGNEDANYKPNYWSVMNYLYQLYGLEADPTAGTAYERWRLVIGDGTVKGDPDDDICSLVNSPCDDPSEHIIDYSNGSSSQLNEDNLLESNNIGRGSSGGAYADWDLSGSLASSPYALDLNADALEDEPAPITLLNDYNDWANLKFPFARSFWGNSGASWLPKPTQSMVSNPITADKQPIAHETPLPARILKQLRREK